MGAHRASICTVRRLTLIRWIVSHWREFAGAMMIFIALLAIAAAIYAIWFLTCGTFQEGKCVDELLCPTTKAGEIRGAQVPRTTAFVIDATDNIPQEDVTALQSFMRNFLLNDLLLYERVEVFALNANPETTAAHFSMCAPKAGKDADPLYENAKLLEKKFDGEFLLNMKEVTDSLVSVLPADQSPILQMIETTATRANRVVFLSDMLQHTAQCSHYRANKRECETASNYYANKLGEKEFIVLYLRRPTQTAKQNKEHIAFWREHFQQADAEAIFCFNAQTEFDCPQQGE